MLTACQLLDLVKINKIDTTSNTQKINNLGRKKATPRSDSTYYRRTKSRSKRLHQESTTFGLNIPKKNLAH